MSKYGASGAFVDGYHNYDSPAALNDLVIALNATATAAVRSKHVHFQMAVPRQNTATLSSGLPLAGHLPRVVEYLDCTTFESDEYPGFPNAVPAFRLQSGMIVASNLLAPYGAAIEAGITEQVKSNAQSVETHEARIDTQNILTADMQIDATKVAARVGNRIDFITTHTAPIFKRAYTDYAVQTVDALNNYFDTKGYTAHAADVDRNGKPKRNFLGNIKFSPSRPFAAYRIIETALTAGPDQVEYNDGNGWKQITEDYQTEAELAKLIRQSGSPCLVLADPDIIIANLRLTAPSIGETCISPQHIFTQAQKDMGLNPAQYMPLVDDTNDQWIQLLQQKTLEASPALPSINFDAVKSETAEQTAKVLGRLLGGRGSNSVATQIQSLSGGTVDPRKDFIASVKNALRSSGAVNGHLDHNKLDEVRDQIFAALGDQKAALISIVSHQAHQGNQPALHLYEFLVQPAHTERVNLIKNRSQVVSASLANALYDIMANSDTLGELSDFQSVTKMLNARYPLQIIP